MGSDKQVPGAGSGAAEAYRKAAPYLDAVWSLIGSVGVWTVAGLWLDGRLHTAPWLVVVGSLSGISLGFYLFFKRLAAADAKARDQRRE